MARPCRSSDLAGAAVLGRIPQDAKAECGYAKSVYEDHSLRMRRGSGRAGSRIWKIVFGAWDAISHKHKAGAITKSSPGKRETRVMQGHFRVVPYIGAGSILVEGVLATNLLGSRM